MAGFAEPNSLPVAIDNLMQSSTLYPCMADIALGHTFIAEKGFIHVMTHMVWNYAATGFADYDICTVIAFYRAVVSMYATAYYTTRLGTNHQLPIVFYAIQEGKRSITIVVVPIVQGLLRSNPKRLNFVQLHLGFPEVRQTKACRDRPLNKTPV